MKLIFHQPLAVTHAMYKHGHRGKVISASRKRDR